MKRQGYFFMLLPFLYGTAWTQDFSLGVTGKFLPSLSVASTLQVDTYSPLFTYGVTSRVHFDSRFSLVTGLDGLFGTKTLVEFRPSLDPNAPPGIGVLFGTERDIQWLALDIPLLYRFDPGPTVHLDCGVSVQLGNLKQIDRLISYDPRTGEVEKTAEFRASTTMICVAPTVQLGATLRGPFSILLGAQYLFFDPTIVADIKFDTVVPTPGGNQTVALPERYEFRYRLSGMQVSCGLVYSF